MGSNRTGCYFARTDRAGSDTQAVTERLFISTHTVQDHLKSVFEKMSIHSRREMLAMFNASLDRR